MVVESLEVFRQRCRSPRANGGFGGTHHAGAHQFGFAFQVGEDLPRGRLILAAGRNNAHHAGAIAVLGKPLRGFEGDAFGAALPYD